LRVEPQSDRIAALGRSDLARAAFGNVEAKRRCGKDWRPGRMT
jgi:hypothetical protein